MATSREVLLKAIQREDDDDLVKIIHGQVISKDDLVNMAEAFVAFSNREQSSLCQRWKRIIDRILTDLVKRTTNAKKTSVQVSQNEENTIMGTTAVLSTVLRDDAFSSAELLLPIVRALHDSFPRLPNSADKLKNRICLVCEQWWAKDLVSKQSVSEYAIIYLLQRTVSRKKPFKVDIRRVYMMRDCLKTSFAADNKICDLLEKCASSSLYLQNIDGRKFIAFAFNLSAGLINALHFETKTKLVHCTSAESSYYGDIYIRAWLSCDDDDIRGKLEDCIQDIIQHAVSASSQKLFTSFFKFLSNIHHHKTQNRIGTMLVRLYEPILWRCLKVANGAVRGNATSIFFSMFPLEDPSAKTVEANEDIQRQLNVIEDLLFDPYPLVRARAILGTCKIFNEYWELIPPVVVSRLTMNLVEKLAYDADAVKVRISVFKGLSLMIENPLTHTFLKSVLPKVDKCVDDVSESVRIVFIEMLLKLRGLRNLKFWDVVPVEHLLERLACPLDTQAVSRRIVSLIFKSYHPMTKGNQVLLERSVALISKNRAASRHFYLYAHNFLSLADTVHFMLLVCQCLYKYTTSELRKAIARGDMEDMYEDPYTKITQEEEDEDEVEYGDSNNLSADADFNLPCDVICGLLDAVSILWARIRPELAREQGQAFRKRLLTKYGVAIPMFYKFFKDSEVAQSMMFLSSFLPSSHVQMSVSYCTSQLRALKPNCPPETYEGLLEYMCNWGRVDDVLELVSDWLNAGFSNEFNTPARTKLKKGVKSVRFQEPREPRPQLGVDFVVFMLKQVSCRTALLNDQRQTLIDMTKKLRNVQKLLNEQLMTNADFCANGDVFSTSAFQLMCKLTVLLHSEDEGKPPFNGIHFLSVTLRWVEDAVLPRLLVADDANSSLNSSSNRGSARLRSTEKRRFHSSNRALALKVIQCSLDICRNTLLVGVVDIRLAAQIANYIGVLLATNVATRCSEKNACNVIQEISCNIQQLNEYGLVSGDNGRVICETTVPTLIGALFKSLCVCLETFPDAKMNLALMVKPITLDILKNYCEYSPADGKALRDVMSTLMAAVVSDLASYFNSKETMTSEELPADLFSLPALSYVIVSLIVSRAPISRLFLKEVVACLKSDAVCDPNGLLAVQTILHTLHKQKVPVLDLKEGLLVLEEQVVKVHRCDVVPDKAAKIQSLVESLASLKKVIGIAV